jgi:rSAM/selenodomain-associated transferase 1
MTPDAIALIVLAKAPVPGRVKTRLCPPCTPVHAAVLARAALLDTLSAAAATGPRRLVLAFDGAPAPWVPRNFAVVPQRGHGLDRRLAAAFEDVGGPALLVGMDTPQLTPALLQHAMTTLSRGCDAVLGPALDGGYWAIGLRRPDPRVFDGVPMSTASTAHLQLTRLHDLGLDVHPLPPRRDVDTYADAIAVASEAPASRFARALRAVAPMVAVA